MTAAQIAERIRIAMQPRRYSLPPEAELYARRHKSAAGQQEFRWITIGAQDHEGGTHVQIKSSTGEIVAGPDALTGKKVGELGKSPSNQAEKSKAKAEPHSVEPKKAEQKPQAKGEHAAILDHLKTGKHTSLSDLRDAIGDSPTLEDDLRSLADDDRISMHKPRVGEPGLWMTPEQVNRHEEAKKESQPITETSEKKSTEPVSKDDSIRQSRAMVRDFGEKIG